MGGLPSKKSSLIQLIKSRVDPHIFVIDAVGEEV